MFAGERLLLVGAVRIELPGHTIRICDGGFMDFQAPGQLAPERYNKVDDLFGTILAVENGANGNNDKAPGGSITFLPKSTASAAALSAPGMQSSPLAFYIVSLNPSTNAVVHSVTMAVAKVDFTVLRGGFQDRKLEMGYISTAEWLFSQNEGNTLSDQFHQKYWPGELGLSNVTGAGTAVAWGADAPPRSSGTQPQNSVGGQIVRRLTL